MKTYQIQLKGIADVKRFIEVIAHFTEDVDLRSGRYTVDAKSIMGIFSLDLSAPINLEVHGDDGAAYETTLKPFLI